MHRRCTVFLMRHEARESLRLRGVRCPAGLRVHVMSISTIVLNWNRAELLRATLRSYAETAREPFDVTVIDNASGDHSRSVIEEAKRLIPGLRAVYHDRNLG